MVDLSKKETNIYVNNKEVSKEVSKEVNNEVNKTEINQIVLNQEIPTREIKQKSNNLNVNKTLTNKQYDTFQLMGLTFKVIHNNMGEFVSYLAKSWAVRLVYLLVTSTMLMNAMISSIGDALTEEVNAFYRVLKINQDLFTLPSVDKSEINILSMVFVLICTCTIKWLTIKSVVDIDTGIENIESKKVSPSSSSTFLKLLALEPVIIVSSSLITNMSESSPILFLFLLVQIMIFMILFKQFVTFSYFEAVAKDKNVTESLSNSYTNLLFSKNGIIIKTTVSAFLATLVYGLLLLILYFGCGVVIGVLSAIPNTFLILFTGLITLVIVIIISQYYTLYMEVFNYLAYMLNEVREDKVDDLK